MSAGWAVAFAATAAGGIAALMVGDGAIGRLARLARTGRPRPPGSASSTLLGAVGAAASADRRSVAISGALAVGVLVIGLALVMPGAAILAVLAIPVGLVALGIHRARAGRRAAAARRAAVIELCQVLVVELQAGCHPGDAFARADPADITSAGLKPALLSAIGDVPTALRFAARQPGAEALASLAACWQVAQRNGAGLATALRQLTDSLRAEEALRREIASQLAGARATARLLAALPALGLLLGSGLGGRPLDVLLHTPYGLACLVVGVTLQVTGLWWTDRIAAAAECRT